MTPYRIAVIDDEQEILDNYQDLLGDDYQVMTYTNPDAFLRSLASKPDQLPHLAITDLMMPGMSGIDMIKKAHSYNWYFPVILLSGYLDKQTALDAVDVGVFRLLEKPSPIDRIRTTVEELLVESEIQQNRREIRLLTSQLRELYTSLRLVVMPYLPENVLDRMVIEAPGGNVKRKMSFDDVLEELESRLDRLLKSEKVLVEMRDQRIRD